MHSIQELQENGSKSTGLSGSGLIVPMAETMTKAKPLLLYQSLKSFHCAVVWVCQNLSNTHHLSKQNPH